MCVHRHIDELIVLGVTNKDNLIFRSEKVPSNSVILEPFEAFILRSEFKRSFYSYHIDYS